MRILLGPVGDWNVACSRVRIFQHLPALAERGVRWTIASPKTGDPLRGAGRGRRPVARGRIRVAQLGQALRLACLAPTHDVTLVQRLLLPDPIRRLLARRARALVFDFDDAIYTTPDGSRAGSRWLAPPAVRWARMLADSQATTVATQYLADRARPHQPDTRVIASPIDTQRYRPAEEMRGSDVVVGWIGSPATSRYLEPLLPVFRRLTARHRRLRIELVGADPRLVGPWTRVREWRWATELHALQALDIGVMPLPDDEWARGKAGYKLLQYMACGVALVASPVGAARVLVHPGVNGRFAADEAGWVDTLTELIQDPAARRRMGRAGRELVGAEYSLSRWTPRLHDVLASVAARAGEAR